MVGDYAGAYFLGALMLMIKKAQPLRKENSMHIVYPTTGLYKPIPWKFFVHGFQILHLSKMSFARYFTVARYKAATLKTIIFAAHEVWE